MQQTPFHAFYKARMLANLSGETLLPAYASANIDVYPYQIAAAEFAMRSPYLKGCVLCDEGSLGKTMEALLMATQKWYEGKKRLLVIVPQNMIGQWIEKTDQYFTLPYRLIDSAESFETAQGDLFDTDALIITTYHFAADHAAQIKKYIWDMVIFDEADCLNKAHTGENKITTALKQATENSFKLLLTPTPIEMDIRDIYGLIYFIDESVLPSDVDEFYRYYFRHPERYAELAAWVSKFCFRTLKRQVTNYVGFSCRVPYTVYCELTAQEKKLYDKLNAYLARPMKLAYPKMQQYDLTLQHFHILSSSAQAYCNTLDRAVDRLAHLRVDQKLQGLLTEETALLSEIRTLAEKATVSGKAKTLITILKKALARLRQIKAPLKAVIFVDNLTTQKYLQTLLANKGFTIITYSGANSRDYSIMERFRTDKSVQILIATDEAAKGLDIEFCPIVVNYDMLTNATQLDQRISRCHRQRQKSDVLVVNLIYRENFADVRTMELINKRVLQFGGIFGLSDAILGNFDAPVDDVLSCLRPVDDVQNDITRKLLEHENENREIVQSAEDTLFTTFTKEIADKVHITPQYIETELERLNGDLWELVKWFFTQYNQQNPDGTFVISEQEQTVSAHFNEQPQLFYYWTNSGNRPYKSQKKYGMDKNFKPRHGRMTLSSILVQGIFHNIPCSETGTVAVAAELEPCMIGLYEVFLKSGKDEKKALVLAGKTESGAILSDDECKRILELPVLNYTEDGRKTEYWLKHASGGVKPHELDHLVPTEPLIQQFRLQRLPGQTEEIDKRKLRAANAKSALEHEIADFKIQVSQLQQKAEQADNRMERLRTEKQLKVLQKELREKEDRQFFRAMQIDVELEEKIATLLEGIVPDCKISRYFVVQVTGNK